MFAFLTQAMSGLEAGIALLTQLLEATVLLMLLDKLAMLIRLTYQAGRMSGRLWYGYGVPAILWLADGISWANSQIDWHAVLNAIRSSITAIVAAAIVVREYWCRWHDVQPNAPAIVVGPPAVNPLFAEAAAMEAAYSVRTFQATVGVKKARTKYQQIASFISR